MLGAQVKKPHPLVRDGVLRCLAEFRDRGLARAIGIGSLVILNLLRHQRQSWLR